MFDILVYMYVVIACAVGLTVGITLFVLGIVGIVIGGESYASIHAKGLDPCRAVRPCRLRSNHIGNKGA